MDFDVPVKQLLTEYELIKDKLVIHRPEDGHKDWCAVTLYGFDSDKTNSHWEYDRRKQRPSITDVGERCPRTIEWVKSLPYARIDDIRFLVLNIHYEHYVENNSDQERVHLLVHGKKKQEFWNNVHSWR